MVCMDARLVPSKFFGLAEGDAHVVRNAGGRATGDAQRSLVISQQLLGTREIYVVHHTDCGMLTFTDASIAKVIKDNLGVDVGGRAFHPFADVDALVKEDVEKIAADPLIIQGTIIVGFVYDVKTGAVREVSRATNRA